MIGVSEPQCTLIVPFMASVFVYENINLPTLKNISSFPRIADAPVRFPIRL